MRMAQGGRPREQRRHAARSHVPRSSAAVLGGVLLVMAWCGAADSRGVEGGLSPDPFVAIRHLSGFAGGTRPRWTGTYVGASGIVQQTAEDASGRLSLFRTTKVATQAFLSQLDADVAPETFRPPTSPSSARGAVSDYHGPKLVLTYASPTRGYLSATYTASAMPTAAHDLAARVDAYAAAAAPEAGPPALYARIQRLSTAALAVERPDAVLAAAAVRSDRALLDLLRNEMALLARADAAGERLTVAGGVTVHPGRSAQIQIATTLYLLTVHHWSP